MLEKVQEVLLKYSSTHAVFICGDMNASLKRHPENDHDKLFELIMRRNDLTHISRGNSNIYPPKWTRKV